MASCSEKSKGQSTTNPNWLELPLDLTKNILYRLDTVEVVTSARNVCPYWWNIFKDPQMWRTIDMSNVDIIRFDKRCLDKICRCAVDLSCGHLQHISIKSFGTDDLLMYMTHRAGHLRRLRISNCKQISDKALTEFVMKFPQLEELDITLQNKLFKVSLEIIGQCCPLLKSLKLGKLNFKGDETNEAVLFTISKLMPGLRHLKLFGIMFDSDELLAILDGCPLLESLDLQRCLCKPLSGSLVKRCYEQIKDLRLPMTFLNRYNNADIAAFAAYLETFLDMNAGHNFNYMGYDGIIMLQGMLDEFIRSTRLA